MQRVTFIIVLAIVIAKSALSQEFEKKKLLYRVIPNENNAVELLGVEKKPKEELVIPEQMIRYSYIDKSGASERSPEYARRFSKTD